MPALRTNSNSLSASYSCGTKVQ